MPEKKIGILDPEGKKKNPLTGKKYSKTISGDNKEEYGTNDYQFLALRPDVPMKGWSNFPMYKKAEEIIKLIRQNDVSVVESGTGTGKTVILPKLALHVLDYKRKIVMTVPKTSLAVSSSGFASKCLDVELGKEVGFLHRGSKIVKEENGEEVTYPSESEDTKFLFATDGFILQMIKGDPKLEKYDIVIIDEAHERSTNIDLLLFYLRQACILRKDSKKELKIIITSATMPKGRIFQKYFLEKGLSVGEMEIAGKPLMEVKVHYSDKNISLKQVEEASINTYFDKIVKPNLPGDSLIFTTVPSKANKLCDEVKKRNKRICCVSATAKSVESTKLRDPDNPEKIYSLEDLASGERSNIDLYKRLYPERKFERKIIISTNVWESSITLNQLKFVIDNGYAFINSFDGVTMTDNLLSTRISKGSAAQRKGRVGRVQPGVCYKMYSKEQEKEMADDPEAPMRKDNIISEVFDFLSDPDVYTINDLMELKINQLLTPPKINNLRANLRVLAALNLIERTIRWEKPEKKGQDIFIFRKDYDGGMSEFGRKIYYLKNSGMKLNINTATSYYYSLIYDCRVEILFLNMFLESKFNSIKDLFFDTDKKACKEAMKNFYQPEGDFMTVIHIFERFFNLKSDLNGRRRWCDRNFLRSNDMIKFLRDYHDRGGLRIKQFRMFKSDEFKELILEDLPPKEINFYNKKDRILYCIMKGFYYNLAERKENKYRNKFALPTYDEKKKRMFRNLTLAGIDRNSVLNNFKTNKRFILYQSLFNSDNGKNFVMCTHIENDILDLLEDEEKHIIGYN